MTRVEFWSNSLKYGFYKNVTSERCTSDQWTLFGHSWILVGFGGQLLLCPEFCSHGRIVECSASHFFLTFLTRKIVPRHMTDEFCNNVSCKSSWLHLMTYMTSYCNYYKRDTYCVWLILWSFADLSKKMILWMELGLELNLTCHHKWSALQDMRKYMKRSSKS